MLTCAQVIPVIRDDIKPTTRHVIEAKRDHTALAMLAQTRTATQMIHRTVRNNNICLKSQILWVIVTHSVKYRMPSSLIILKGKIHVVHVLLVKTMNLPGNTYHYLSSFVLKYRKEEIGSRWRSRRTRVHSLLREHRNHN